MPNRDFDTATWVDPWFEALEPKKKLLFIYLWTNNHCTQSGMYYISESRVANETGLTKRDVETMIPELNPKVLYDPSVKLVWVRNFLRKQRKNDKFLIAVGRSLSKIKPHAFLREFSEEYQGYNIDYLQTIDSIPIHTYTGTGSLDLTITKDSEGLKSIDNGIDLDAKFEVWWTTYGKKVGKKETRRIFFSTIPRTDESIELLMLATQNYLKSDRVVRGYKRDPENFIKKDFWKDFIEAQGEATEVRPKSDAQAIMEGTYDN